MSQKNLISELSSYYRLGSISTINYEYPMNISTYQNFAIYSLRELNVVNTGSWLLCGSTGARQGAPPTCWCTGHAQGHERACARRMELVTTVSQRGLSVVSTRLTIRQRVSLSPTPTPRLHDEYSTTIHPGAAS